jgi:type I restriction enzyme R subunit
MLLWEEWSFVIQPNQTKELFRLFEEKIRSETDASILMAAEPPEKIGSHDEPKLTAALILHEKR